MPSQPGIKNTVKEEIRGFLFWGDEKNPKRI